MSEFNYLTIGLLLLILGNMLYLERTCAILKKDMEYIKSKVCGNKNKKEVNNEQNTTGS